MPSLISTWRTWASTVRSLRKSRLAIPRVREALGHQREHLALALGERGERAVGVARRRPGAATTFGSSAEPPRATRSAAVEELADVEHAVLEQVAEAAEARRASTACVVSMCWESTSTPTSGCASLDRRAARAPSSVNVGGIRMSSTDEVGAVAGDRGEQAVGVADATATTSWPPSANSRAEPLAQQHLVLGDHDPHGSSAVERRAGAGGAVDAQRARRARRRGRASPLSPEPVAGARRPTPSSLTLTTSAPFCALRR